MANGGVEKMTEYKDRNGVPVNAGDVLLYNEGTGYAYGVHEVVEADGILYGVARTADDDYKGWREVPPDLVELRFYTNFGGSTLVHAEKIGALPEDAEMLTLAYAVQRWAETPNADMSKTMSGALLD